MDQRLDQFLALSAALTGFSTFQLRGTGMAADYLHKLDETLPAGVSDELLTAYHNLPPGTEREAAIASSILPDPKLGPVARNLILLWYRGFWTTLSDTWHNAYGPSPAAESSGYVSAKSYQSGLQWIAAGAHPPGSRQQGFGSWSGSPERSGP